MPIQGPVNMCEGEPSTEDGPHNEDEQSDEDELQYSTCTLPHDLIKAKGFVTALEFAPFVHCTGLLAVGAQNCVTVWNCYFEETQVKVLYEEVADIEYEGISVKKIRWCNHTFRPKPKLVFLIISSNDFIVRMVEHHSNEDSVCHIMDRHRDYVNDAAFNPITGEHVASVSDDGTCRVYEKNGYRLRTFKLSSPGISVAWHIYEADKVMVAERNGIIRFYCTIKGVAVKTIYCFGGYIQDVKWSTFFKNQLFGISASSVLAWTKSRSLFCEEETILCPTSHWKFCDLALDADIFIIRCASGKTLKVIDTANNQVIFSFTAEVGNAVSLHFSHWVAIGEDDKICFCKLFSF